MRLLRRHSLERRLFGWLLALALVPVAILLLLGTLIWSRALNYFGTLGPWTRVAESGRAVLAAADTTRLDPALAAALARHEQELSSSLSLAQRWAFIGERIDASLPAIALLIGLVMALLALAISRKLARQLARPIRELVTWTDLIARDEPLPPHGKYDRRAVQEVRVLRDAFRQAAVALSVARGRAVEAERVRVWGEMARRVAHEMKNPLTPLRLASRRLDELGASQADLQEPIAVIREETGRLEELARRFAALGRPAHGPTSEVDVRELVATLLASDVAPPVEASLTVDGEVPLIEGHYEELVRAFRNLLRNAMESMEGMDGVRRVEVRIAPSVVSDGAGVEVAIRDAGSGIAAGAEESVFEPDYTTKSRGTGLGLTLVRQAVTAHGGSVSARTLSTGGAEFSVRLPTRITPEEQRWQVD